MSDRELKRWASDQLHELLGFSQGYLADYVLSLARKERTVAGLVKALGEADVPGGERTQRFARELIERTPRARADAADGGAAAAAERSRKEAAALLRQNEQYGLEEAPEGSVPYPLFLQSLKAKLVERVEFEPPSGDVAYAYMRIDGDDKPATKVRMGQGWPVAVGNSWSDPIWVVRILENEGVPYKFNFDLAKKEKYPRN